MIGQGCGCKDLSEKIRLDNRTMDKMWTLPFIFTAYRMNWASVLLSLFKHTSRLSAPCNNNAYTHTHTHIHYSQLDSGHNNPIESH